VLEFYSVHHFATRRLRTFLDPYSLERSVGTPQQSRTLSIVEFEIGFIAEHSVILFLTHILKCTNPLWLASFQTPEFAYL
jgi:hypothetical protein